MGYIDRQGKMVIPPQFDTAWPFFGGLGEVIQGETEGYIDKNRQVYLAAVTLRRRLVRGRGWRGFPPVLQGMILEE